MIRLILWMVDWNLSSIRRDMIRNEAIRLIATSLRQQVNPCKSLRCLALDYRGTSRRQLVVVADSLAQGHSLSRSMAAAVRLFPDVLRDQVARVESNRGALQALLDGQVERYDQNATAELELKAGRGRFRQWASFFATVFVLTFIMVFIVPTFEQLFVEFGMSLPAPTEVLIDMAGVVAGYWFVPLFFAMVGFGMWKALESTQWFNRWVLSRLLPSRRRAIRSARMRIMASLIETGTSPVSAIDMKSHAPIGSIIDWQSVLRAGWLTSQEGHLLSQLQTPQEAQWCLHRLADYLDFRNNRRTGIARQLLQVAGNLLFGFIVAVICISLYMPLVTLISGLT